MIQFDFGRLEQVELRTVWVSEDSDFATWLARGDSLALLGGGAKLGPRVGKHGGLGLTLPTRRGLPFSRQWWLRSYREPTGTYRPKPLRATSHLRSRVEGGYDGVGGCSVYSGGSKHTRLVKRDNKR